MDILYGQIEASGFGIASAEGHREGPIGCNATDHGKENIEPISTQQLTSWKANKSNKNTPNSSEDHEDPQSPAANQGLVQFGSIDKVILNHNKVTVSEMVLHILMKIMPIVSTTRLAFPKRTIITEATKVIPKQRMFVLLRPILGWFRKKGQIIYERI